MYNYIGCLKRSTAVKHSIKCNFFDNNQENLIVSKGNVIEFFNIIDNDIKHLNYITINGNVTVLESVFIPGTNKEDIFLLTEDMDWCILHFKEYNHECTQKNNKIIIDDEDLNKDTENEFFLNNKNNIDNKTYNSKIITVAKGSIKEDIGKRTNIKYVKKRDYILFSAYKNILKVVFTSIAANPIKNSYISNINNLKKQNNTSNFDNKLKDFSLRYEYDEIIDLVEVNFNCKEEINKYENLSDKVLLAANNEEENIFTGVNDTYAVMKINYENLSLGSDVSLKLELFSFNNKNENFFKKSHFDHLKSCSKQEQDLAYQLLSYQSTPWDVSKPLNNSLNFTNNPDVSLLMSPKIGGILVFFSNKVVYYHIFNNSNNNSNNNLNNNKNTKLSATVNIEITKPVKTVNYINKKFISFKEIDNYRYIICDEQGNLFFLGFKSYSDYVLQFLGEIGPISSITNIHNSYFYIGSCHTSSKIINILKGPNLDSYLNNKNSKANLPQIEIINEYQALSPINDFAIQNVDERYKVVCISGINKECNLKTVMKGSSIKDAFSVDFEQIRNIHYFNLIDNESCKTILIIDFYLCCLSFKINQDYSLELYENNILEEILNVDLNNRLLLISNLNKDCLMFVFNYNIILVDNKLNKVLINLKIQDLSDDDSLKLKIIEVKFLHSKNTLALYLNNMSLFVVNTNTITKEIKSESNNIKCMFKELANEEVSCFEIIDDNKNDNHFCLVFFSLISNKLCCKEFNTYNDNIFTNKNALNLLTLNQISNINEFSNNQLSEVNILVSIKKCINVNSSYFFCSSSKGDIYIFSYNTSNDLSSSCIFNIKLLHQFNISNKSIILLSCKINDKDYVLVNNYQTTLITMYNDFPISTPINCRNSIEEVYHFEGNTLLKNINLFKFSNKLTFGNLSSYQTNNIQGKHIYNQLWCIEYLENLKLFLYIGEKDTNNSFKSFLAITDSNQNLIKEYDIEQEREHCQTISFVDSKTLSNYCSIQSEIEAESFADKLNNSNKKKSNINNNNNEDSKLDLDVDVTNMYNTNSINNKDYIIDNKSIATNSNCNNFAVNNQDKTYVLLGTAHLSYDLSKEPDRGRLLVLELSLATSNIDNNSNNNANINNNLSLSQKLNINQIDQYIFPGGVSKLVSTKEGLIFACVASTLHVLRLTYNNKYNSSSNFTAKLKLLTELKVFNYICDISLINNNTILVSDAYRSVSCYKYIEEKEKLIELCRDYSPIWINTCTNYTLNQHLNKSFFIGSDIENNLIVFRSNLKPRSDDERYKIDKVSFMNIGERVNKFRLQTKKLHKNQIRAKFTSLENEVNYVVYGTLEGSIGVVIELNRKDYEYLSLLSQSILKILYNFGEFSYNKFRAFKDSYQSEHMMGFVEGNVLEEFLRMNDDVRKHVIDNMNYPWSRSVNHTVAMIEMLKDFH